MRLHSQSKWHGACALCGVICLAILSGCSSSKQAATDSRAGQNTAQGPSHEREDPPPSAKTLYSMADILATQGKDVECEFVLRRCINQYPRFIPAYNSLAELQMRQGRVHQAADILLKALAIRPQDPVLQNNLGMCHLVKKQYEKALDRFTKAAGLVPESEKYRANMATALGLLGRHEEAFALLQQVLPEREARNNADVLRQAAEKQATPEKPMM